MLVKHSIYVSCAMKSFDRLVLNRLVGRIQKKKLTKMFFFKFLLRRNRTEPIIQRDFNLDGIILFNNRPEEKYYNLGCRRNLTQKLQASCDIFRQNLSFFHEYSVLFAQFKTVSTWKTL